jgi:hypothetical protein
MGTGSKSLTSGTKALTEGNDVEVAFNLQAHGLMDSLS